MPDRRRLAVAVVETATARAGEEVVVGPPLVHVRVDSAAVGPGVVRVGGEVGVVEPAALEVGEQPGNRPAEVERRHRRGTRGVAQLESLQTRRGRDLLGVAEHAAAGADTRQLRPQHQSLELDDTGVGVDQDQAHVARQADVKTPRQDESAVIGWQDAQRGALDRRRAGAIPQRECARRRGLRVDRRRDVDLHVFVQPSEHRDDPAAVELPHDLAAEHRQAFVPLRETFVTAPRQLRVLGKAGHVEVAVAEPRVHVEVPCPDGRRVADGHPHLAGANLCVGRQGADGCRKRRSRQRERHGRARRHFLRASSRSRPVAVGSATPASFASVGAMSAGEAAAS